MVVIGLICIHVYDSDSSLYDVIITLQLYQHSVVHVDSMDSIPSPTVMRGANNNSLSPFPIPSQSNPITGPIVTLHDGTRRSQDSS